MPLLLKYIPFYNYECWVYTYTFVLSSLQGDSGGPLMCQIPGQDNWKLFGISSFGMVQCGAAGNPSVFTRVINYIDWIQNITDQEN